MALRLRIVVVAAAGIALSGCGGGAAAPTSTTGTAPLQAPTDQPAPASTVPPPTAGTSEGTSSTTGTTGTVAATTQPTSAPIPGELPADMLAVVLAHASGIAGVDASRLTVVRAEFVEWSDGSLGCPEPGMLYPQVITPGYWVEVAHPGETLDYRLTEDGAVRLCEVAVGPNLTTPTTTGGSDS